MALTLPQYFTLLGGLGLLAWLLAWLFMEWRERAHGWNLSLRQLCHCPTCRYIFLTRRAEHLTTCPACKARFKVITRRSHKQLKYL